MAEQASHGLAAVISCSGNSPSVPSSVAAGIPLLRLLLPGELPLRRLSELGPLLFFGLSLFLSLG